MNLVEQRTIELPTVGGGLVSPRRVFCVGRNFADHATEMGGDPSREPPFFFLKPRDALIWRPQALPLPPESADVQHEVELALVLGRGGFGLDAAQAEAAIGWCAVAIDLTRRDQQREAKATGRPWAMAKGFDRSAPIGTLTAYPGTRALRDRGIRLLKNGDPVQRGLLAQMVWSPAEIVSTLSRQVELAPGDVILCGTPAGVGPLAAGDRLEARIDALPPLYTRLLARDASTVAASTPEDLLDVWFAPGDRMKRWFSRDKAFDRMLGDRFGDDLEAARAGELEHWAGYARGRLGLVVLLDQLSRNLHRGKGAAFAADGLAREHAAAAVRRGEDRLLATLERAFLYLPFEHAESMSLQDESCRLFRRLHDEASADERPVVASMLDYAERHRDVIQRFGRFPHRNAALGRDSTPAELVYLKEPGAGF